MLLQCSPSAADGDHDRQAGPDALVAMARELAERAPSWPSMARPVFRSSLIRRRWDLGPASDTFEAWFMAWPPGGALELHDHGGSAGAIVVTTGELAETRVVRQPAEDIALRTTTFSAGRSIGVAEQDIHGMVNVGAVPAISVHVYSPPLTSLRYNRENEEALRGRVSCGCATGPGEYFSNERRALSTS